MKACAFFQAFFVGVHVAVAYRPGNTADGDSHTGSFDERHDPFVHNNFLL